MAKTSDNLTWQHDAPLQVAPRPAPVRTESDPLFVNETDEFTLVEVPDAKIRRTLPSTRNRPNGAKRRDKPTLTVHFSPQRSSRDSVSVLSSVQSDNQHSGDMSIEKSLETCTKYVLEPYNGFLKMIGWRSFQYHYQDRRPSFKRACNVIYPAFIVFMLIFTSFTQTFLCFSRNNAAGPISMPADGSHSNLTVLNCSNGLVRGNVLPDLMILVAYIWAMVVFRVIEPEHLFTLIETVFLSYDAQIMGHQSSQKRLICVLLSFFAMGAVWVTFSTLTNIARVFALGLDNPSTVSEWFIDEFNQTQINQTDYHIIRLTFLTFSLIGFLFFDLLFVAVMVNYSSQCELLQVFIRNIKKKVLNKGYLLGDAVKEMYHVQEFMEVLNGHLSYITTLVFFVCILGTAFSFIDLTQSDSNTPPLNIIVGILNILQWFVIALLPLVQAARLTSECRGLRHLGLEVGARPYIFSETPLLILDSFVSYTATTNFKAKLAFMPVYPEGLLGVAFFFVLLFSVVGSFYNVPLSIYIV